MYKYNHLHKRLLSTKVIKTKNVKIDAYGVHKQTTTTIITNDSPTKQTQHHVPHTNIEIGRTHRSSSSQHEVVHLLANAVVKYIANNPEILLAITKGVQQAVTTFLQKTYSFVEGAKRLCNPSKPPLLSLPENTTQILSLPKPPSEDQLLLQHLRPDLYNHQISDAQIKQMIVDNKNILLSLADNASEQNVKERLRHLFKQWHPDVSDQEHSAIVFRYLQSRYKR